MGLCVLVAVALDDALAVFPVALEEALGWSESDEGFRG